MYSNPGTSEKGGNRREITQTSQPRQISETPLHPSWSLAQIYYFLNISRKLNSFDQGTLHVTELPDPSVHTWLSLGSCSTCGYSILSTEAVCCSPQSNWAWSCTEKKKQKGDKEEKANRGTAYPCMDLQQARGTKCCGCWGGSSVQGGWIVRTDVYRRRWPETGPTVCTLLTGGNRYKSLKLQGLHGEITDYTAPIIGSKSRSPKIS